METNFEHIIKACIKGERSAQHELYHRLSPRMYAVCLQYTRNEQEAEDCLQEGFIKLFNKLSEFRNEGSFEGWVRRIMVNTTIEHYRKNKKMDDATNIDQMASVMIIHNDDPGNLNADYLLSLIQSLPPQYRMVFTLYAIEGYSHEEIAQELNIAIGTSKSNLARARKWLQDKLEKNEPSNTEQLNQLIFTTP